MKLLSVGAKSSHADGRTDGQTDGQTVIKKLIAAIRNFAKAPINV